MESELDLPLWQPDSEVSECPECHTHFTFWYRKHHCRKCGRVVCANCSPHRITIPTQYIVQPPAERENDFAWSPAHVSRNLSSTSSPEGGQAVRVCKPCVPDPWTPQSSMPDWQRSSYSQDHPGYPPNQDEYRTHQVLQSSGTSLSNSGSQRRTTWTDNRNASTSQQWQDPAISRSADGNQDRRRVVQRQRSRRHTMGENQTHASASHATSTNERPLPPLPPRPTRPSRRSSLTPRRVIREEDECPVCGCELPAGEAVREEHVMDCISNRFSSTPSQAGTTPGQLPPSNSVINTTQQVPSAESAPPPTTTTRPRASSYRPRGMALYRATEKDCINGDGEPLECVICFEEFQAGDELGRMECLCKFHRVCIRQWWDTKGTGSCPTHQLHE